jgi:dihydrodipicolinate reductase
MKLFVIGATGRTGLEIVKVEQQEAAIGRLKQDFGATIARLEKQVEALTAGLQKVSAQLEASKPAPHVVKNP